MKNRTLRIIFTFLLVGCCCKQGWAQTLFLNKVDNAPKIQVKIRGLLTNESADDLKKIKLVKNLRFDFSLLPDGATVKFESTPAGAAAVEIEKTGTLISTVGKTYVFQKTDPDLKILRVTVTLPGIAAVVFDNIGVNAPASTGNAAGTATDVASTYTSWRDYMSKNHGGYLDIIKGKQRYFSWSNTAYICLDPFGNLIGKKPVNLDQDDNIIILMIVPNTDDFDNFSVNDNDATYAPTDLSIRPMDAISIPSIQSATASDVSYTVKVFEKGPYTSSDVTFTIMLATTMLSNVTVHINPLYHLGLGVSYVSSSLSNPTYQVVPLTTSTNTIKAVNDGRQTFLTLNAIWYWSATYKYFFQGSDITRGRDVLKEPDLLSRINPTFGVGLKGNLENNFFLGFNFEFARGGSLSGGWHYGKVTRLLDDSFQLGTTQFAGQQTDIKTTDVWRWGGFFGVTLDTRIFNKLFSSPKPAGQ